jgi:hypothetical protein
VKSTIVPWFLISIGGVSIGACGDSKANGGKGAGGASSAGGNAGAAGSTAGRVGGGGGKAGSSGHAGAASAARGGNDDMRAGAGGNDAGAAGAGGNDAAGAAGAAGNDVAGAGGSESGPLTTDEACVKICVDQAALPCAFTTEVCEKSCASYVGIVDPGPFPSEYSAMIRCEAENLGPSDYYCSDMAPAPVVWPAPRADTPCEPAICSWTCADATFGDINVYTRCGCT